MLSLNYKGDERSHRLSDLSRITQLPSNSQDLNLSNIAAVVLKLHVLLPLETA